MTHMRKTGGALPRTARFLLNEFFVAGPPSNILVAAISYIFSFYISRLFCWLSNVTDANEQLISRLEGRLTSFCREFEVFYLGISPFFILFSPFFPKYLGDTITGMPGFRWFASSLATRRFVGYTEWQRGSSSWCPHIAPPSSGSHALNKETNLFQSHRENGCARSSVRRILFYTLLFVFKIKKRAMQDTSAMDKPPVTGVSPLFFPSKCYVVLKIPRYDRYFKDKKPRVLICSRDFYRSWRKIPIWVTNIS